jgi:hypothetical protein
MFASFSGGPLMTAPSEQTRADELELLDHYWRAANYLSVGQTYLLDNPLLREPLKPEHIKPRLLGHWGTTPGLNIIYAHLNRAIRASNLSRGCGTRRHKRARHRSHRKKGSSCKTNVGILRRCPHSIPNILSAKGRRKISILPNKQASEAT